MKGMLFKGEMVRAMGREIDPKWQTRRGMNHPNLKETPKDCQLVRWEEYPDGTLRPIFEVEDQSFSVKPPYRVGETVYVKETWRPVGPWECREDRATVQFRADESYSRQLGWPSDFRIKSSDRRDSWRPSLLMPEWAARYFLKITDVRAEWLPDISHKDAMAEGVQRGWYNDQGESPGRYLYFTEVTRQGFGHPTAREAFRELFESIYGPDAWERWVWVYDFQRVPKP